MLSSYLPVHGNDDSVNQSYGLKALTFELNFEICEKQYLAKESHEKSKANTWQLLYIEYMQEYLDQNSNLVAISSCFLILYLLKFSDTSLLSINCFGHLKRQMKRWSGLLCQCFIILTKLKVLLIFSAIKQTSQSAIKNYTHTYINTLF